MIPVIVEKSGRGEQVYDLYSKLLQDRIIIINGVIEDDMAMSIVTQLLYLNQISDDEITMYINSPGGVITAGMAIYDTMKFVNAKIKTVCIGQAASMGAFLLSSGDHRCILPHARVMIHQPLGGAEGQATDIAIQAKEILKIKSILNDIMAKNTKQSLKKISKDTDRDFFMNAQEALNYGIVDEIVER